MLTPISQVGRLRPKRVISWPRSHGQGRQSEMRAMVTGPQGPLVPLG